MRKARVAEPARLIGMKKRQAGGRRISKMFFVYIISSETCKSIYVGLSNDVQRRFLEHQKGYNKTTRSYRPFRLIHVESFKTRIEARNREKCLKSGFGKCWIKENFL